MPETDFGGDTTLGTCNGRPKCGIDSRSLPTLPLLASRLRIFTCCAIIESFMAPMSPQMLWTQAKVREQFRWTILSSAFTMRR